MTNEHRISRLVALWYETIGPLHHKERDTHFRISQHWKYDGQMEWEVEHEGYLTEFTGGPFKTREAAEVALIDHLANAIDSWLECDDHKEGSYILPYRLTEIAKEAHAIAHYLDDDIRTFNKKWGATFPDYP